MKLYHGTSVSRLDKILKNGLQPRSKTKKSNWDHTVKSNPKDIYLTSCYSLYYGFSATRVAEDVLIIEVDTDLLDERCLHADEDALEQLNRHTDSLPDDWDMNRRTIYYRTRSHLFSAGDSLKVLGTCAYRGSIPLEAITKIITIDQPNAIRLIATEHDPTITIANFRYLGRTYEDFQAWLAGDLPEYPHNPSLTREGISIVYR